MKTLVQTKSADSPSCWTTGSYDRTNSSCPPADTQSTLSKFTGEGRRWWWWWKQRSAEAQQEVRTEQEVKSSVQQEGNIQIHTAVKAYPVCYSSLTRWRTSSSDHVTMWRKCFVIAPYWDLTEPEAQQLISGQCFWIIQMKLSGGVVWCHAVIGQSVWAG